MLIYDVIIASFHTPLLGSIPSLIKSPGQENNLINQSEFSFLILWCDNYLINCIFSLSILSIRQHVGD